MPEQPNGVSHDAGNVHLDQDIAQGDIQGDGSISNRDNDANLDLNGHKTSSPAQVTPPSSPRSLKRKLSHPSISENGKSKKLPSPPWKKFDADRPSSFVEEGKRRSGRTNAVPLTAQSQTGKRQTRAAYHHSNDGKRRPGASPSESRHGSSQDASFKSQVAFKKPPPKSKSFTQNDARQSASKSPVQLAKHPPSSRSSRSSFPGLVKDRTWQRRSSEIRTRGMDDSPAEQPSPKAQVTLTPVKSLRLNFRRPPIPILHPGNVIPQKKYPSFQECLDQNEPLADDGERRFTASQVREEALLLQRLERAATPGGVLSGYSWLADDLAAQAEPGVAQTHPDYLFAHVKMFHKALKNERARHVREAKALAHAAAQAAIERWKGKQPQRAKTQEELAIEEQLRLKSTYRYALRELKNKWYTFSNIAKQQKMKLHEQEQDAITKQALGEMLERSSKALENRKQRRTSTPGGYGVMTEAASSLVSGDEAESSLEGEYSTDTDNEGSDDDDDSSSSDEDVDETGAGSDDDLTPDEIRLKYAQRAETAGAEADEETLQLETTHVEEPEGMTDAELDVTMRRIDPSKHEIEEVAEELLDSEHEESESEDGTEDSNDDENSDSGSSASNNSGDASEDDQPGLLGFFSAAARKPWAESTAVENTVAEEADEVMVDADDNPKMTVPGHERIKVSSEANSSSDERSVQGTPATTVTSRQSERDGVIEAANAVDGDEQNDIAPESSVGDIKTKIPSLLRGQLREYQHYGLDWLAGMYASETNGILADEMGLGKTIQTIALLAHLAVEREIWGPHLIVVPTSVMLNWEMEFKKWCPGFKILTYYGTQEERKAKRKGWLDNDRWHVCITSYQLALQDQSSLKKRSWHYMVLDEAHNIKNFRSQRWQTLLSFKTQARLLLTGTPLQNNLTELWSLLFFLSPEVDEEGHSKFADLKTFSTMFRHPVEQILDHGREAMDDEARDVVNKLHQVLRPHLLRRLKSEVEKQMPKKYEHIVKCRLSKRQRQLYDGYMGLAGTRESFASGNYMSIINCLMQLRKVCNHPDLFETRQIVTSYAMPRSAIADYEIKELLVRRRCLDDTADERAMMELLNLWRPNKPSLDDIRTPLLAALKPLETIIQQQAYHLSEAAGTNAGASLQSSLTALETEARRSRLNDVRTQIYQTALRVQRRPVYSRSLIEWLTIDRLSLAPKARQGRATLVTHWDSGPATALQDILSLSPWTSQWTDTAIQKFGCITPAVVAPNMTRMALTNTGVKLVQTLHSRYEPNLFHESQTRLSIAFPDKSLIQYDCGKLQQLARLLRDLQAGGHRALIFTQMTKVLDILEQFMNLHGHRYLRLDGSTKVEQRQALTDQFNRDTRILAFILSSRSGGLGINLTGADTVIFYDLDWNPAMDKQCQDRCHRIGQTRDVHIYRFVSEGTIEANILRKSNQKRMLDDVVIQEGEFTTDVFNREAGDEFSAEADAALDKVLGGSGSDKKPAPVALEQAEDKEDRDAAIQAQKEDVQTDAVDFEGKPASGGTNTPDARFAESPAPAATAGQTPTTETEQTDENEPRSYEDYMLRFMEWELRDFVFRPFDNGRKKSKKGKDQGIRIRR